MKISSSHTNLITESFLWTRLYPVSLLLEGGSQRMTS